MRLASIHTLVSPITLALLAACGADANAPTAHQGPPGFRANVEEAPRFSAWSEPVNLGPPVNTPFVEQGTSLSRDGLTLYFQCRGCDRNVPGSLPGSSDIYVSRRTTVDAPWGPPQQLGPNINTIYDDAAPRVSIDGHRLFFNSDRPVGSGGADLYVSRRRDHRDELGWEPAMNLGPGINSDLDEVQADPFEDETGVNVLHYAVGPRASGGTDIYVSMLREDGTYGPGTPVAELNSGAADRQPAIRRDGLEMFLASTRSPGHGALDLWVATRATTRDPWSAPVNLGPVVNGSLADARPALSFDGTTLYFQSTRAGAVGCGDAAPCPFDLWVTTRTRLR